MSEHTNIVRMPASYYVGRGELMAWLGEWGFSESEVRRLIDCEVIVAKRVPHSRYHKYVPRQVAVTLELGVECRVESEGKTL